MGDEILTDLYRMGSAATDAGLLDWLRTIVLSGVLVGFLRSTFARGLVARRKTRQRRLRIATGLPTSLQIRRVGDGTPVAQQPSHEDANRPHAPAVQRRASRRGAARARNAGEPAGAHGRVLPAQDRTR